MGGAVLVLEGSTGDSARKAVTNTSTGWGQYGDAGLLLKGKGHYSEDESRKKGESGGQEVRREGLRRVRKDYQQCAR